MENQNIKYKDVPLIKEIEKLKEIEKCNDNILYYGEGGIGKTTQMQLAFNYFSSKCTNTVPVFLDADKEIDFRKADPLMSAIACKYLGSDIETDDIWKLFTNNSPSSAKNYTYIIFVDGINELTQNNKGYLIEKITHIISESKNTRFIISSRIKENLGLRFKNIAIKPLEKKNILKYLGENYGVNDNSKNINDSLVEILQIPLYLSVFKNTYKGSDYKPNIYDESTVRKADILDSYIQKILHEKRKTNAADTALFEFIVKYFLPALAFEMVKENVFSIDYDSADRLCESTKYFKGIAKRRFVAFDINGADTICVSNCALLEAHNDVYTFPHQIWRDYFCAKHIINCLNVTYSEQIQNDLEIPVDNEIRGFVGQLIYTYDEKFHYSKDEHFPPAKSDRMCECDFEAKDNLEDWDESPIEHYMQQHNLEQKEQNQISPLVTRNLIEIMKNSRNNKITCCYSKLNLLRVFFIDCNLENSSFTDSYILEKAFKNTLYGIEYVEVAVSSNNGKSLLLITKYKEVILIDIEKRIVIRTDYLHDFARKYLKENNQGDYSFEFDFNNQLSFILFEKSSSNNIHFSFTSARAYNSNEFLITFTVSNKDITFIYSEDNFVTCNTINNEKSNSIYINEHFLLNEYRKKIKIENLSISSKHNIDGSNSLTIFYKNSMNIMSLKVYENVKLSTFSTKSELLTIIKTNNICIYNLSNGNIQKINYQLNPVSGSLFCDSYIIQAFNDNYLRIFDSKKNNVKKAVKLPYNIIDTIIANNILFVAGTNIIEEYNTKTLKKINSHKISNIKSIEKIHNSLFVIHTNSCDHIFLVSEKGGAQIAIERQSVEYKYSKELNLVSFISENHYNTICLYEQNIVEKHYRFYYKFDNFTKKIYSLKSANFEMFKELDDLKLINFFEKPKKHSTLLYEKPFITKLYKYQNQAYVAGYTPYYLCSNNNKGIYILKLNEKNTTIQLVKLINISDLVELFDDISIYFEENFLYAIFRTSKCIIYRINLTNYEYNVYSLSTYDKAYFNRKMYYNKSKIIYKYMNDDYDDNLINQNIIEPSKLYSCNISNCIFNDRFNKIDKEEIIYNGGIVI